jgi:hypothetical protein
VLLSLIERDAWLVYDQQAMAHDASGVIISKSD